MYLVSAVNQYWYKNIKIYYLSKSRKIKKKKRKKRKMVLANIQTFICHFIYELTGYKNSKLTLLQALYSQDCNFPCKLLYSTLLNAACFSRGKKTSLWQWSFLSEFFCNLCLQATCLCRGGKKKPHHSKKPNSTAGTVITELRKFTVPQAFQSTKSLTTLLKCIFMKNIINSSVISSLTRGSVPQRIS